jgi:hypothetical protein
VQLPVELQVQPNLIKRNGFAQTLDQLEGVGNRGNIQCND